ncbi:MULTISPECIES: nucleotidyltransferase domain-containing protein [Burkholderiaceae]|uniref:nucleotidyltransferase family protein n=1 Tax=Burkholderiaceae TaxID=119060 RepID=UPI0030D1A1D0
MTPSLLKVWGSYGTPWHRAAVCHFGGRLLLEHYVGIAQRFAGSSSLIGQRILARVFGSAARSEDKDSSDLNIFVDPTPDTSLLDIGAIQYKLQALLGVPVDALTPKTISIKFRDDVLVLAVSV